jgi:hypothetical protein
MSRFLPFDPSAPASDHKPPRPAIDLQPIWKSVSPNAIELLADAIAEGSRRNEANRIWDITRQVAEGTNPPQDTI